MELQLQETAPFLSLIKASFLELPEFDFIIKPMKTVDVMDIPGFSKLLRAIISGILSEAMVEPNQLLIPVDQMMNEKLYSNITSEHRKFLFPLGTCSNEGSLYRC